MIIFSKSDFETNFILNTNLYIFSCIILKSKINNTNIYFNYHLLHIHCKKKYFISCSLMYK